MSMTFPQSLHAQGWTDYMPSARPKSTHTAPMNDLPPLRVEEDEAMPVEPPRGSHTRGSTWIALFGVGAVAAGMAVVYAHDPARVDAEIGSVLARAQGTLPESALAAQGADAKPQAPQGQLGDTATTPQDTQQAQTPQPLAMTAPAAGTTATTPDSKVATASPSPAPTTADAPPPMDTAQQEARHGTHARPQAPKPRVSQFAQAAPAEPALPVPQPLPEQQPAQAQSVPAAIPAQLTAAAAPPASSAAPIVIAPAAGPAPAASQAMTSPPASQPASSPTSGE